LLLTKVVKLIEDIICGNIDVITFTSPPSARDLFKIANIHHMNSTLKDSLNENVIVAAVGPSTREVLEENGCHVDVMPQIFKMGPMVTSLCDYIDRKKIFKEKNRYCIKKPCSKCSILLNIYY
jgi:uroporphyrinogen-III synthase